MRNCLSSVIFFILAISACSVNQTPDAPIVAVTFDKVKLHDRFWAPRLDRLRQTTIPHLLYHTDFVVNNLRLTGEFLAGDTTKLPVKKSHQMHFETSDLFKTIEAIAYSLHVHPDPALEARMDSIIGFIASAQQPDGYMYIWHTCGIPDVETMGEHPYERMRNSHELYNMGHLYEAAVAYARATGKEVLLQVAEKHAHHVNRVFFEGDPNYNAGRPIHRITGHPEIEPALCKLYEHTHDSLYLRMARRFLEMRGANVTDGTEDELSRSQEDKPLKEQHKPQGHAVCAAYIYTGMTDVDALGGTSEYQQSLTDIWDDVLATRIAITGGLGSVPLYEGFGAPYELPNKDTYNETCAAVANVFWQDKLFLSRHHANYFDVLECSLFNGALGGINLEGNRFSYLNPLEADGVEPYNLGTKGRFAWTGCACCPTNIARMLAQAGGFMYAHTDRDIYCTLYGGSSTEVSLADGVVGIEQTSDYPFSGESQIVLTPDKVMRFNVRLRIPTWAQGREFLPGGLYTYTEPQEDAWSVQVNGKTVKCKLEDGFAVIRRQWEAGDKIALHLPMQPRYVQAHPEVKADSSRLAVVCGPLVYCAEEADNGLVQEYYLPDATPLQTETVGDGLLRNAVTVTLTAKKLGSEDAVALKLVPYYAWDNRGDSSMLVWIPQTAAMAHEWLPQIVKNREWLQSITLSRNNGQVQQEALFDGKTPARSHHQIYPRWNSKGYEGEPQCLEFVFKGAQRLESVSVFWISDARTTTLLPEAWDMEYLSDGVWHAFPVYVTDSYGRELDIFNPVRPSSVLVCEGLRLNLTPQPGKSVGIGELKINVRIPGFQDSKMQGFKNSRIQGFQHSIAKLFGTGAPIVNAGVKTFSPDAITFSPDAPIVNADVKIFSRSVKTLSPDAIIFSPGALIVNESVKIFSPGVKTFSPDAIILNHDAIIFSPGAIIFDTDAPTVINGRNTIKSKV
jgi:DUF1680 family protein